MPEPTDRKSVVEINNVPPKANYVAPNAADAIFALILTTTGMTTPPVVFSTGHRGLIYLYGGKKNWSDDLKFTFLC